MSDDPTTAAGWFDRGMRDIGLSRHADHRSEYVGDLEDAVASFDRALALDASLTDAHWQRGLALALLDRHAEALEAFAAVSRLKAGDAAVELATAQSLAATKDDQAACAAYERALALRPDDGEARYGHAESLTRLRRDIEAVAAWDMVLAAADNRTIVLGGRAVRVLTDDFRRARARLLRAGCLSRLGRADACAAFSEALAAPSSADALVSEALREHEAARAAYAGLLEASRAEPGPWHRAARHWLGAQEPHRAVEAWGVVLGLTPGDPRAWYGKAEAHAQAGELDAAVAAYRKALELWPEFSGAAARLKVVEAQARRRDMGPAREE